MFFCSPNQKIWVETVNVFCTTLNRLSWLNLVSSAAALLLMFGCVGTCCTVFYVGWDCCLFQLDSQSGRSWIYGGAEKPFFFFLLFFVALWCFLRCEVELLLSAVYADCSIWLKPLASPGSDIFIYIYLCNQSPLVMWVQFCRRHVKTVFFLLTFSFYYCVFMSESGLNALINSYFLAFGVCHVISWLCVILPAFICVLRKWEVFPATNGLFTSFFVLLSHSAFTWRVFTITPSLRPSAKWCRSSSLSFPLWRTSWTSSFL